MHDIMDFTILPLSAFVFGLDNLNWFKVLSNQHRALRVWMSGPPLGPLVSLCNLGEVPC